MRSNFTQESDFRQQRDFGQKITATFEFIGAHWRELGRALLFIVLPAAILQGILSGLMQKELLLSGVSQTQVEGAAGRMAGGLAAFTQVTQSPYYSASILAGGIFLVLMVLTVYVYMNLCLRPGPFPEPIGVAAVWAGVKAEFISSFLSYFGLLIVVIIGMFLLVVPGIYLSVALSIFFVVKVVESTGFGATVSRSLRLTRGKWWSTLGLMFVMSLLLGVCSTVVGAVIGGIVGGIGGALGLYKSGEASEIAGVFAVLVSSLGALFYLVIYPPLLIALAFQYFNLVERIDGVGLRNMVGQLGQTPVPVANAAYRPDEEGEY
ncbi:hypothetical protein [Hymenobacter sp. IS2118]|uniref:hypothetical protein n=1 Tax=Hymenobacter sp. IS2118 TaxID=1505605 RepID=UPI000557B8F4|nr:hypothetical protein [Hymenobacter sp. IS2118]